MSNDTRTISQWTHGRLGAATRETPRVVADEGQSKTTKPRTTQAQRDYLRENAPAFAPNVQETIHLLDDADAYARLRERLAELVKHPHRVRGVSGAGMVYTDDLQRLLDDQ